VEKAGRIIEVLGDHVATTAQARGILGLRPPAIQTPAAAGVSGGGAF
jgi:hypothetical protein